MKYNLTVSQAIKEAKEHLGRLIVDGKTVDIKEVKPRRSLNQNSFLHLLLGAFSAHFGFSLNEGKSIYKMLPGNKELYHYTKELNGRTFEFVRSSADLDKTEMTKSIETLREWSAKMGYPLPTAQDEAWLQSLENDVERNERYL